MIREAVIGFFENIKESLTLSSAKLDKSNRLFRTYNIFSFLLTFVGIATFVVVLLGSIVRQGLFPSLNEYALDNYYNVFTVCLIIFLSLGILITLWIDRKRYVVVNRKEIFAFLLLIICIVCISLFGYLCYNYTTLHNTGAFTNIVSFGNIACPNAAAITYIFIALVCSIVAYLIADSEKTEELFELLSLIINTVFVIPFVLYLLTNLKDNLLCIILLGFLIIIISLCMNISVYDNVETKVVEEKKEDVNTYEHQVEKLKNQGVKVYSYPKGTKLQVVQDVLTEKEYIYRNGKEVCSLEDFINKKVAIFISEKRLNKIVK